MISMWLLWSSMWSLKVLLLWFWLHWLHFLLWALLLSFLFTHCFQSLFYFYSFWSVLSLHIWGSFFLCLKNTFQLYHCFALTWVLSKDFSLLGGSSFLFVYLLYLFLPKKKKKENKERLICSIGSSTGCWQSSPWIPISSRATNC